LFPNSYVKNTMNIFLFLLLKYLLPIYFGSIDFIEEYFSTSRIEIIFQFSGINSEYMSNKASRQIDLIIERSADENIWGRVLYDDNLLVDSAKSLEALEKKFQRLLERFHNIDTSQIKFRIGYDLAAFFEHKPYLNISAIAKEAGINPALMRQYVSGNKSASAERVKKIEQVINRLGNDLKTAILAPTVSRQ
jgi:hypothetical protein